MHGLDPRLGIVKLSGSAAAPIGFYPLHLQSPKLDDVKLLNEIPFSKALWAQRRNVERVCAAIDDLLADQ